MKKWMCLVVAASLSLPIFAQTNASMSGAGTGPRRQIAMIMFSGLAGAVLGLSTISFYGRPQEHLGNVTTGAAVGIIVGTIYTTYLAAARTQQPVDDTVLNEYLNEHKQKERVPALFSYRFEF